MIKSIFTVCLLFLSYSNLFATSISDSILNIPKGTIFKLKYELTVPANQNFLLLGQNYLQESFNNIYQQFNKQNNNYSYNNNNYLTYNNYFNWWIESTNKTYNDCLERHRSYYSYGGSSSSSNNNVIINNGSGNTNIIVNNQQNTTPTYGSYIQQNSCIRPEHTLSALLLNSDKTKSGGIFRENYKFEVSSVTSYHNGNFYIININFNHKVASGIRIITTTPPQYIHISSLIATKQSTGGFWDSLGTALASMTNIGGDYFDIEFPSVKYFD